MSIGTEIKKIRINSLLSQTEFAKALGVSFSTVNRWENDKVVPNFQTIKRIRDFCNSNDIEFTLNIVDVKKGD